MPLLADVFVFIDGTLAVNLGGVHCGLAGSVDVDTFSANVKTLEIGNVYSVAIFHAERQSLASNFQITFSMCVMKYCPGDEPEENTRQPQIRNGKVCDLQRQANEKAKNEGPEQCS